jgi:hypothetical protein
MRVEVRWTPGQMEALDRAVLGAGTRALDMGPPLRLATDEYLAEQSRLFGGGAGWAPLTAGTVKAKSRRGEPGTPGVGTGGLQAAATHRRGTKGSVTYSGRERAVWGNKDPTSHLFALGTQARVQTSTGRRTGEQPARPSTKPSGALLVRTHELMLVWLVDGVLIPHGGLARAGGMDDTAGMLP